MLGHTRKMRGAFFILALTTATISSAPQQGTVLTESQLEECGRTVSSDNDDPVVGEFPYFCTLYVKKDDNNIFVGGATLLSRNTLLSLATLFSNIKLLDEKIDDCTNSFSLRHDLFASCGTVNIKSDENSRQDKQIQKIIIHPEHSNTSLINDYAILVTQEPFTYTEEVGRVCLTHNDADEMKDFDAELCVTLGHGPRDDVFNKLYSDNTKKSKPALVDRESCEDDLNSYHFARNDIDNWKLHSSHICAGNGVEDTCKGDGGGPLLCKYDVLSLNPDFYNVVDFSKYYQVGVTAWGANPCQEENTLPGVYSRVSVAKPWIEKTIRCNDIYPVVKKCKTPTSTKVATAGDVDLRDVAETDEFGLRTIEESSDSDCVEEDTNVAEASDFGLRTLEDCSCV